MRITTHMAAGLLVSLCWLSATTFAQRADRAFRSDTTAAADYKKTFTDGGPNFSGDSQPLSQDDHDSPAADEDCAADYATCRQKKSARGCGGWLNRPGQFFFAADYLYVRSTFSDAPAYTVSSGTPTGNPAVLAPPVTHTFQQLDFDYESNYRFSGGYRFCDCGGEIRFNFTRFSSGATAASPPADQTAGIIIYPHINEPLTLNGDNVSVTSGVDLKSYDLGFAKTIPLGTPACDPCADTCCDTCCEEWDPCCSEGCRCCPAWDIKWSAGARYAEVDWDRNTVSNSTLNTVDGTTRRSVMDFEGGGVRLGLEGTRYIGKRQNFSLFAKSDLSLLLGTVDLEYSLTTPVPGSSPVVNDTVRFSNTQIIPVLDLEVGGNVFVTNNVTLSAGYLFSAWFDLGMRDTFDVLPGIAPTMDDANILGFDGLFARAEVAF